MRSVDDIDLLFLGHDEDAPQIAGIIDERPDELKYAASKWKVVNEVIFFNKSINNKCPARKKLE